MKKVVIPLAFLFLVGPVVSVSYSFSLRDALSEAVDRAREARESFRRELEERRRDYKRKIRELKRKSEEWKRESEDYFNKQRERTKHYIDNSLDKARESASKWRDSVRRESERTLEYSRERLHELRERYSYGIDSKLREVKDRYGYVISNKIREVGNVYGRNASRALADAYIRYGRYAGDRFAYLYSMLDKEARSSVDQAYNEFGISVAEKVLDSFYDFGDSIGRKVSHAYARWGKTAGDYLIYTYSSLGSRYGNSLYELYKIDGTSILNKFKSWSLSARRKLIESYEILPEKQFHRVKMIYYKYGELAGSEISDIVANITSSVTDTRRREITIDKAIKTFVFINRVREQTKLGIAEVLRTACRNVYVEDDKGRRVSLEQYCKDFVVSNAPYLAGTSIAEDPVGTFAYVVLFGDVRYMVENVRIIRGPGGNYMTIEQAVVNSSPLDPGTTLKAVEVAEILCTFADGSVDERDVLAAHRMVEIANGK